MLTFNSKRGTNFHYKDGFKGKIRVDDAVSHIEVTDKCVMEFAEHMLASKARENVPDKLDATPAQNVEFLRVCVNTIMASGKFVTGEGGYRALQELDLFVDTLESGAMSIVPRDAEPEPLVFDAPKLIRELCQKELEDYFFSTAELLGIEHSPQDAPVNVATRVADKIRRLQECVDRMLAHFECLDTVKAEEIGGARCLRKVMGSVGLTRIDVVALVEDITLEEAFAKLYQRREEEADGDKD